MRAETWLSKAVKVALRHRRSILCLADWTLLAVAFFIAFSLRFEGTIPGDQLTVLLEALPWIFVCQATSLVLFQVHRGMWRYTGLSDIVHIIAGVFAGTVAFFFTGVAVPAVAHVPHSVIAIDLLVVMALLSGSRLARRVYLEASRHRGTKKVLVFGAGKAGEMIVRDMRRNPYYDYEPIGFIDDDPEKAGRQIHDVPVLGTRRDLPSIMSKYQPDEILVALSKPPPPLIRGVVKTLEAYRTPIKILPSLRDVLNGSVTISQIRHLSVEDLLERSAVRLGHDVAREFFHGKQVLVTGAGGSIGSELCRQISQCEPGLLILFEQSEENLYNIDRELRHQSRVATLAAVGDVTDYAHLGKIIKDHRVQLIFHAAAYKHVPLMQNNICAAIKNNVRGTRFAAAAAREHGVERFVLVSSDKAVKPTSVMGATKRVAELLVQTTLAGSRTEFLIVRFGNVLSSSGSVVPLFLEQIRKGGPVTVTHPEVRRFFMLIPEAVDLMLHASARGEPGFIYLLEMGESVRILDMARNLIRLAGLVPEEDIQISFIGLRPGEKLSEELVDDDTEIIEPSGIKKVLRLRQSVMPEPSSLMDTVLQMESAAYKNDHEAGFALLHRLTGLPLEAATAESDGKPVAVPVPASVFAVRAS
jgi:FlaA1/EpsC-like NDP-sugar epimerase